MPQYVNRTLQEFIMKNNSSCITLIVTDNHNMVEEIRVSIIIIQGKHKFKENINSGFISLLITQ